MDRSNEILQKHFSINHKGKLVIGGLEYSALTDRHETPLYVYDLNVLDTTYQTLMKGLPESVSVFYSMKANPSLGICHRFKQLGSGIEVASLGELQVALKAGFKPEDTIFAGPGKKESELRFAIEKDIRSINVESISEIDRIARLSKDIGKCTSICIRINPQHNKANTHQKMGGVPSPFGIDEELIPEVLPIIEREKHLRLKGIHVYVGNQIFDWELAIANIKNTLEIARNVTALRNGKPLEIVNLGGGLAVPYYTRETDFNEDAFKHELRRIIEDHKKNQGFAKTTYILELGRYLVATCGIFLVTVLDIKTSRNKAFVIVDGGMNLNSLATSNFGQKIRRKFPICVPGKLSLANTDTYTIVGPLCTPMDSFGSDYNAPALEKGDLIAALYAGAYGFSGSPQLFLSHPVCAEIGVYDGRIQVFRHRQSADDLMNCQLIEN